MTQDLECRERRFAIVNAAPAQSQRNWENRALRIALCQNLVSFPSQAPTFAKQSRVDIHWKVAVLYFVRGWSMEKIASRYQLARQRVGQIITDWRKNAVIHGYVQIIEPEGSLLIGQVGGQTWLDK